MPHHPLEKIIPDVQPECALVQLEDISSFPVPGCLREMTDPYLAYFSPSREQ